MSFKPHLYGVVEGRMMPWGVRSMEGGEEGREGANGWRIIMCVCVVES